MNIWAYAAVTYLATAAISLLLIGTIVLLNKVMGSSTEENLEE